VIFSGLPKSVQRNEVLDQQQVGCRQGIFDKAPTNLGCTRASARNTLSTTISILTVVMDHSMSPHPTQPDISITKLYASATPSLVVRAKQTDAVEVHLYRRNPYPRRGIGSPRKRKHREGWGKWNYGERMGVGRGWAFLVSLDHPSLIQVNGSIVPSG